MLSPQYGLVDAIVGRLDKGDMDGALRAIRSFLASIPYDLGSRDEKGFQLKFYLIFRLLGIQIDSEVKTETGRVDAVVQHRGSTYVMEFKYDGSAGEALRQIDERGYLIPYEALDSRLVKVGVNFSSKEQTIEEGWIIQGARCYSTLRGNSCRCDIESSRLRNLIYEDLDLCLEIGLVGNNSLD